MEFDDGAPGLVLACVTAVFAAVGLLAALPGGVDRVPPAPDVGVGCLAVECGAFDALCAVVDGFGVTVGSCPAQIEA
ncbi:MAG: hypothetical protein ABI232_11050 [Jatrophihabitantaceae bacterium]